MFLFVRVWLTLAAVVLVLPVPASARTVQCGEVITVDTRVDNDLVCPTPVALEIGANGVDLDLHGHTVEAIAFETEGGGHYDEGIGVLDSGYDDVSVSNGTVIGNDALGYGLRATDADRLVLRRLTTVGYATLWVSGNTASLLDVTARGFGVNIFSDGAVIDRFSTSSEFDLFGHSVEISDSAFRNVFIVHGDGASVHGNTFTEGVGFPSSGNSVVRNQGGRWFVEGSGNTFRGNRITAGLVLVAGASGNLIRDNIVGADFHGFPMDDAMLVAAGATGNTLVGNTASGATDDGIDVEEPSTTLRSNRAFGNGDLGIEAVAGVIDGGGNRAYNNGNPLQCLNVDCR